MFNISHANSVLKSIHNFMFNSNHWCTPSIDILSDTEVIDKKADLDYQPPIDPKLIEEVLSKYKIPGKFKDYYIGSSVTTYEIQIPQGTKISALLRAKDDLARDLGAPSLRIIQSMTNSSSIGLEFENKTRYLVGYKEMFKGIPTSCKLPIILGEDTYGNKSFVDLTSLPHLLIAGQTGSGKSVFLNTIITTLICKYGPDQLKFIMVDPKQVEFAAFENLPHLYEHNGEKLKIASDAQEAREVLEVAVSEMERRFELLKECQTKKIDDYNAISKEKLPYIVFVIDEFADLMLMGSSHERKEVENNIIRIAQKARAVGIHMILATQKPLAQIMTTLIKANMPARISFSVSSASDSRVILDVGGAETLTGNGDMLFRDPLARSECTRVRRIQAPWISDQDIQQLIIKGKQSI